MKLPEDPTYRAVLYKYQKDSDSCVVFRIVAYRMLRKGVKEKPIYSEVTKIKWTASKLSVEHHQAVELALGLARKLKNDTEEKVNELLPKIQKDVYFEDLCDIWFDEEIAQKSNGSQNQNQMILKEIKAHFASSHIYVKDLIPEYILGFYQNLLIKKKSTDRIRRIMKVLKRILEYAIAKNYLSSFDLSGFSSERYLKKPPKNSSKKSIPLTWEQGKLLVNKAKGTSLEDIAMIRLHTGMRIEEACGLPWRCVDLKNDIIIVMQVLTDHDKVRLEKFTAKSDNSLERWIPIDPELHDYLIELKKKQERNKEIYREMYQDPYNEDLVIRRKNGSIQSPKSYSRGPYKKLMTKDPDLKQLPYTKFYDIRHTFANHAVDIGVPLRSLAQIMGDDIKTVEQYYLRVQDKKIAVEEYKKHFKL